MSCGPCEKCAYPADCDAKTCPACGTSLVSKSDGDADERWQGEAEGIGPPIIRPAGRGHHPGV